MTRKIKKTLESEISSVNISMSEKLKNTPLNTTKIETKTKKEQKTTKFFPQFLKFATLSLTACIMILCLVISINSQTSESASALTSYIVEINPSFNITTNQDNSIVNVISLNDYADSVLLDETCKDMKGKPLYYCINKLIDISIKNNFIEEGREIKLFSVNNSRKVAGEKNKYFEDLMLSKFNSLGFKDVQINKDIMPVDEFNKKMGFEHPFNDLDKMKKNIEEHNGYFDPNKKPKFQFSNLQFTKELSFSTIHPFI